MEGYGGGVMLAAHVGNASAEEYVHQWSKFLQLYSQSGVTVA